jgi:prepilin-type N-terminal cleavage/methylation domain-containing protein/prepilin-type processing-associated H-X9-DG protein
MSAMRTNICNRAMSLIELLCVIAIIALLAALLLPAISQVKARAKRAQCVDHLHQMGIGFVSFANEHHGQFPMSVPASAGGTLELAQGGYLIQGDFYFSYRHFQAASNELVTPRLLVCPADTRLPASSFATLGNSNLSYFIGVNAGFARATSVLAGDRNLTNDYATPGTLIRLGHNYALRWTEQMHRFKGNLLFGDAHVEEKNSPVLVSANGQVPAVANLALPTVQPARGTQPFPGRLSFPAAQDAMSAPALPEAGSPWPADQPNDGPRTTWTAPLPAARTRGPVPATSEGGVAVAAPQAPKTQGRFTNGAVATAPAKSGEGDSSLSPFAAWLAAVAEGLARKGFWWLYALFVLVVVTALAVRKLARHRHSPAAQSRVRSR